MYSILLWLALILYFVGIVLTVPSVMKHRPSLPTSALAALGLGLGFHAASLVVRAVRLDRLPVIDVQSALSFFAFLVTLAFFLAYLRYRINVLGLFMLPLVFVLTLFSALRPGPSFQSMAFRSGWLMVHISCIMLGYVGFFLTFVAAVMYLIQERQLKSRNPQQTYYRLPSLEVCDQLYSRSLRFGLPFLTVGILTGFFWAAQTWHGAWELDPKILAALITWLIYLFLFSARLSGTWPGRLSAYVAIVGFAAIMVTFVGISFVSGWHGYIPRLGRVP
ncbi:MAG TPA: cytochrome c biogenesis protein CcsA [Terriglobia bacterium]|nr:cytochrome c biogenesis protein CcsA [Terriglobia bacterium]